MSFCKEEGKDKVIFVTKEDHNKPSSTKLEEEYDDEPGLILPNGDINWNCPCLGGMATGPCGYEFREAFTCFNKSTADPKGSDCYEAFSTMQKCMTSHPTVYDTGSSDKDDDDVDVFNAGNEEETSTEGHSKDSDKQSTGAGESSKKDDSKSDSSKQSR